MLKIDFYILEESVQPWMHFVCGLVEAAYTAKQSVYIHHPSQEEASRLDAALWTYKDISFLPHQLCLPTDLQFAPIGIGHGSAPVFYQETLFNLSSDIPVFYTQFKQVIEIVLPGPTVQQLARSRYRQYRDQGHQVNTHKIEAL
jgi:DNA polymerase-3 subunit chi